MMAEMITASGSDRRQVIGGLLALQASAAAGIILSPRQIDHVVLPDFRPPGASDDMAALAMALATGRPVYLPGGRGSAPDGAYLIESSPSRGNLLGGANLFGDGIGRTIVRKPYRSATFIFFCNSNSADPGRNLSDIRLADMTLEDDVVQRGFAEDHHLMHLNGVTRLIIERVGFHGFRGDGLHLGSGHILGMERHNRDITVRGCVFDGINSNNRNGISIIDGEGVIIEDCQFLNCSRPGYQHPLPRSHPTWKSDPFDIRTGIPMPGAIDCEPNADAFAIIRNVRIERCRFSGGGGAAVALLLRPNNRLKTPHANFTIKECMLVNQRVGFMFFGYVDRDAIEYPVDYGVLYENNRLRECDKPFIINGARGLMMRGNEMADCSLAAELGYTDYNHNCRLLGNRFVRLGYGEHGINGMLIRNANDVVLSGNQFVDCGRADGSGGRAISFVQGNISRFQLINNRFESPTGRTTYAIGVMGAVMDRKTSVASGNVFTFATNRDFG